MKLTIFLNDCLTTTNELDHTQTNKPVLRKNNIFDKLKNNFITISHIINKPICIKWLSSVHDIKYLDFLSKCYDDFVKSNDNAWSNSSGGLVPYYFSRHMPPSNTPIYKLSGFYCMDNMTPIYADTYANACISANQAYLAADHIFKNGADTTYVLASSPGHHAKHGEYGGYCFFNNAIISAKRLVELCVESGYQCRVGILDLDYHAGNGTFEMVKHLGTDDILAWSIHCDPTYDYPSFEGYDDETFNFTLGPKTSWDEYVVVLNKVCQIMVKHELNYLIIAFGGDTYKDDPDASILGRFGLDIDDYFKMGSILNKYFAGVPKLITQEGGYDMDKIGDIVNSFFIGLRS